MRVSFFLVITMVVSSCTQPVPSSPTPSPMGSSITKNGVHIKEKWRTVLKIRSPKPQKTPVFRITGREWKISWKNTQPQEFFIILYEKDNPDYSEILVNSTTAEEDVIYLEGKKAFYLETIGKGPYEVIVEELR
ncbi:MAG: hypothetical protein ACUVRD_08840 [Bacteroidia bacterium]